MNNDELAVLDTIDEDLLETVTSRRTVLKTIGGVAGSGLLVSSIPLAFAGMSKTAFAQAPQQILDVLNFALTLEHLEAEFYTRGTSAQGLIPSNVLPVFEQIRKHETAHVAFLQSTISSLGGTPVAKPTFDFTAGGAFPDPFAPANYQIFLALSQAFEDTGVRAYKGQAANLMSNDTVLTAALQIHSVEARHASEVRRIRGQKGWITGNAIDSGIPAAAAPVYAGEEQMVQLGVNVSSSEAFDEPLTKEQVLAIASLFIS